MDRALLDSLLRETAGRMPVALVTWLASGRQQLVRKAEAVADAELGGALDEGFRTDRSRTVAIGGEDVFINIYNPPLRMVVIGAVHIAQALIPLARQASYDVIIVDPRTAFASGAPSEPRTTYERPDSDRGKAPPM